MNKKNKIIGLNLTTEDNNINDFLYCWEQFGSRPNKLTIYSSFTKNEFNSIISEYKEYKNSTIDIITDDEFDIINDKSIIKLNDNVFLSYYILDRESDNSFIHEVIFFYKSEEDLVFIDVLIQKLKECNLNLEYGLDSYKLNTLTITQNGIDIEPIELEYNDKYVELFYNSETFSLVNKLTKKLKKTNKGLTILYGERGTGKTNIIKYISNKLDKMVIYIPNNMLDVTLNSPDFRNFIKKYPKLIIVLDDCEMIFNEIYSKSNIYVNNILQMVDGILSESIDISIVTIFNVESENEIDHLLLDCNSLIDIIHFDYLTTKESNNLSKHLKHQKKYKNKNRLVDIIKNNSNKDYKKIGLN